MTSISKLSINKRHIKHRKTKNWIPKIIGPLAEVNPQKFAEETSRKSETQEYSGTLEKRESQDVRPQWDPNGTLEKPGNRESRA